MSDQNQTTILKQPYTDCLVAALVSSVFLIILYLVLRFADFDVTKFSQPWIAFPFVGMAITSFTFLDREKLQGFEITKRFILSLRFYKIAAVFLTVFLIWSLGHAVIDWAIEPDMIDHGTCPELSFGIYEGHGRSVPCGTEDMNWERRWAAQSLIDRTATALFILSPVLLASKRFRKLIRK